MQSITVTAKIQICPDNAEKELLYQTMTVYQKACNFVSGHIFRTHNLKQISLNQELYYDLREKYNLRSQMAQSVIKTVIARYKAILENQKKWIKARFKRPQFDCCRNCGYQSNDDRIGAMNLYRMGIAYLVPDTAIAEHLADDYDDHHRFV